MVRLSDLPEAERAHLLAKSDPPLADSMSCEQPFVPPVPLHARRIALVTTAGVHLRGDDPFAMADASYRVLPGDAPEDAFVMSHSSVNFDRTGFQQDLNVVFPLTRFRELVDAGAVGGLAQHHYSFMGALLSPAGYEASATQLARVLRADGVDTAFLTPV
jgi:D-proline reductase (dithiol) PrdB